jgi:hypothetical protein
MADSRIPSSILQLPQTVSIRKSKVCCKARLIALFRQVLKPFSTFFASGVFEDEQMSGCEHSAEITFRQLYGPDYIPSKLGTGNTTVLELCRGLDNWSGL